MYGALPQRIILQIHYMFLNKLTVIFHACMQSCEAYQLAVCKPFAVSSLKKFLNLKRIVLPGNIMTVFNPSFLNECVATPCLSLIMQFAIFFYL